MWRRALLAAAAVSYLICVLIMSGMQKEDLDVSMLRKLQRYNVNMDDIDNEQLRQQCFSRNNGITTSIRTDKMNDDYASITKQNKSSMTTKFPLPVNMDAVLNYIKTQQDSLRDLDGVTTQESTSEHQNIVTTQDEHVINEPKIDMNVLRRYIQLETQKRALYKHDDNSQSTKQERTFHLKTNEGNPIVYENNAFIDKLFKDYLLHKQTISTTTEHIATYTINIQNIYKQIDEIMASNSNTENIGNKILENNSDQSRQRRPKDNVTNRTAFHVANQDKSNSANNGLLNSFYRFLSVINQFKNGSGQSLPSNSVYTKDNEQSNMLLQPFILNRQEKYKETTTHEPKPDIEPNQKALTTNLVKEIAETVREVIIKDLRDEMSDIYRRTTRTTTETVFTTSKTTEKKSPTTTPKSKVEGDASIIDKFMELYKQIKSLNQTTFILRPNNESVTLINEIKQEYTTKNPVLLPLINGMQIPHRQIQISSYGKYNTKQYFNQDPYVPIKEKSDAGPITIQTNSIEIKPLAIPISKPQNLIRQNIIVDKGYRFQGRDRHRPKPISVRGNSYTDIRQTHRDRTFKHSPGQVYDRYNSAHYPKYVSSKESKQREDIIRFRLRDNGNSRFDTDYYEKINFENDYNAPKEKHLSFNIHNIPKFHERLERTDRGSDGVAFVHNEVKTNMQEQDNTDIPSRQQLSLIDMKRGTSYNNSHFKNFLKSQQKVTDMLEKILAIRPKTNTPHSVETV